jgi:hypothetical protein
MQKRFLFSPVAHFWLFDAMAADGSVNENVFAFVNRERGERALVLYNNKYERASGRIFRSSPKLTASPDAPKGLETRTIAEALGLNPSPGHYYLYRDSISGLEYIRSGSDAAGNGIEVELDGFKYRVYLDWREVYDETGDWEKLARRLGRRGVPDIRRAFEESRLEPVHRAFEAVVQTAVPLEIAAVGSLVAAKDETETAAVLEERFAALIRAIQDHFRLETDSAPAAAAFHQGLAGTRALRGFGAEIVAAGPRPPDRDAHPAIRFIRGAGLPADGVLFLSWLTMASLALLFPEVGALERRRSMEALWLDTPLKKVFGRLGRGEFETSRSLTLLAILRAFAASASGLFRASGGGWPALLADDGVRAFLGVNEFEGVWYYSKENFEELVDWLFALAVLSEPAAEGGGAAVETARSAFRRRGEILDLSLRADYRLDALRNKLGPA